MDQNKRRRPRTLEERFPNGPPKVRLGPKGHYVSNNHVFKDHTGKPALMSWESISVKSPLPPLASWVYYIVHPDAPRDFDGRLFHDGLTDSSSLGRGGRFRYEFFFLPGATAEECVVHFRGELESRGTIWRQTRKVERVMQLKKQQEEHDSGEGKLPGLVWLKPGRHGSNQFYRGHLFIYTDAEIETRGADGEARHVYLVEFDPIPQEREEGEDDEDYGWDLDPMKYPVYSRRLKVRDQDSGSSLGGWMEEKKIAQWEEEANHATGKALDLGWESW
ncbi:hypothetical protein LCI18_009487 [Fusarium solani-melongenae]|uniref:Uncharacterized protein n=1 Tax=Fusarium solani subsp. cucurbitae TaxID=2747967 RepID=A0ACD3ZBH9_FUSSC|nr:hypothetical protein LCI18_009487 [Fusarium solani-melongenae]